MWTDTVWDELRDIVIDNCYTEYIGGEWVARCYSYPGLVCYSDSSEESLDGIEELAILMLVNVEGDDGV